MSEELVCKSCPDKFAMPAAYIGNAYAARDDGSSWDWPLCWEHSQWAMVAGWLPIRKVDEDPPYDPEPHLTKAERGDHLSTQAGDEG